LTMGATHTALWLVAPALAASLTMLEAILTVTVILTALYAPVPISDRAFRMLPWTTLPRSRTNPAHQGRQGQPTALEQGRRTP
jgi:hypothetical protein